MIIVVITISGAVRLLNSHQVVRKARQRSSGCLKTENFYFSSSGERLDDGYWWWQCGSYIYYGDSGGGKGDKVCKSCL